MNTMLTRIAALLCATLLVAACSKQPASESMREAANDTPAEHALKHANPKYRCPMHPDILRDEPGNCPICGMTLVKVLTPAEPPAGAGVDATEHSVPLYYRHPHDPNRTSPVPKKDEMGMDYLPVFSAANRAGGSEIRI